jgi:hydroxyacylglutathione hydrolase
MNTSKPLITENLEIIEKNSDFTIYKITVNSNIYFIDGPTKFLIDCGDRFYLNEVKKIFDNLVDTNQISAIILTHFHYDHIGCLDLFPNADIYAHPKEIDHFNNDNFGTVLNNNILKFLKNRNILAIDSFKSDIDIDIIHTPGHTIGSMCLFFKKYNLLFTGDTYFGKNIYGRVDLPSSVPELMAGSLKKLEKYKSTKIFPGHDY